MSTGLVICSNCHRVVHQTDDGWFHCGVAAHDVTPRCEGAHAVYPARREDISGRVCESDGPAPSRAEE